MNRKANAASPDLAGFVADVQRIDREYTHRLDLELSDRKYFALDRKQNAEVMRAAKARGFRGTKHAYDALDDLIDLVHSCIPVRD